MKNVKNESSAVALKITPKAAISKATHKFNFFDDEFQDFFGNTENYKQIKSAIVKGELEASERRMPS